MKSRYVILIGVVLVLLVGGFIGWSYIKSSPQFSLYKMYQAIEAHDYESFTKYVDVDSVIDNMLDKALEESKQEEPVGDEWYELGKSFAEGLIMMMKPRLKEEANAEMRRQIESGEFKKEYKPQNIVKAFTKIRVQKEGKVANMTLTKEDDETLSLKMRKKDGYWQVFDMEFDLPEIETEETEKGAQQLKFGDRADIGKGWYLTVNEPVLYEPTDIWDEPKEGYKLVASEVVYENTSQETNYFSLSNLKLKDVEDHSYSEYLFGGKKPRLESGDLEAGGKVKGFVTFEILEDAEAQSIVYSGTYSTVVFSKQV